MAVRFLCKIDARFPDESPQALGAQYLRSGEIQQKEGVALAIAVLFGPIGAVRSGQSREVFDEAIAHAERVFTNYIEIAKSQARACKEAKLEPEPEAEQKKCSDSGESDKTVVMPVMAGSNEYADDDEAF